MSESIGSFLQRRRRELGLTQAELAGRLSMGRSTYAGYEADNLPPLTADLVEALANALDMTVAAFLHGAGYTLIPTLSELTPATRRLVAAVSHLDEGQIDRLADAVRVLFPPAK